MKNIHILSTDQPSRLQTFFNGDDEFEFELSPKDSHFNKGTHIYITSDEKFKENEWVINNGEMIKASSKIFNSQGLLNRKDWEKIILTTDQDLIKDGIQAIDDEFLEWFVKNPTCEFVRVYDIRDNVYVADFLATSTHIKYEINIPQEEPKKEYQSECICEDSCRNFVNVKCKQLKKQQEALEEDNQTTAIRFLEWYRRKNVFFQFQAYHIPNPGDKNWEQTVFHGDNSYLTSRQLFAIFKKENYE